MHGFMSIWSLASLCLLAGCAQVQQQNVARSMAVPASMESTDSAGVVDAPIVLSATLNNDLSSEYFGYFEVTLENKSDRWITVSEVKVSFADSFQNANIAFVSGNEFMLWQETMAKIITIRQHNRQVTMATVGALGAGLATLSNDRGLQALGTAAAAGAAGAYGASRLDAHLDSLRAVKKLNENHLLADSILLLPGLFSDRWLLVNSRRHDQMEYVTDLYFEIKTTDGDEYRYVLTFRPQRSVNLPKWQKEVFERKGYRLQRDPSSGGYNKNTMMP